MTLELIKDFATAGVCDVIVCKNGLSLQFGVNKASDTSAFSQTLSGRAFRLKLLRNKSFNAFCSFGRVKA